MLDLSSSPLLQGADVPGAPRGGDATVAGAAACATGGGTEGPGDAQFGCAQQGLVGLGGLGGLGMPKKV